MSEYFDDGVGIPADHFALTLERDLRALAISSERVHRQPAQDGEVLRAVVLARAAECAACSSRPTPPP